MFLEKFRVKNYRGIKDITLDFNKGLNILIGENNSGKSSVIDALRLCLSYGNQKRETFVSIEDFYIDQLVLSDVLNDIEFHLNFKIEAEEEKAWFYDMLNTYENGTQDIQIHFRYYTTETNNIKKVRFKVWGGCNEGQQISNDELGLFYFVYLGALRNVENFLKPVRGNRLGQLYSNIKLKDNLEEDKLFKKELGKKVGTSINGDEDWTNLVQQGKGKINEHLKETCYIHKQQKVEIDFLPFDFFKLVDSLKIQIPIYSDEILNGDHSKQKFFDLDKNGLGYNNLIYTATVLGDLQQKKEVDKEIYAALLIEEPEAHLHPQLQSLFFNYLNKLNKDLNFQVFISSHSPTITAKANLNSILVLQNIENNIHCLSLDKSGLTTDNKKYLQKFLDVTKAQLFFSNGVILVEGISEALLLPIFSKMLGEEYDIEKAGIELININGVAFEHFANLFNNPDNSKNLQSRCSLITDDDRDNETDEISSRATNAKALEEDRLKVFLAKNTFEYELFITNNNKDILLEIFNEMHPRSMQRLVTDPNIEIFAQNFLSKVNSNQAKSELAHRLAIKLEDNIAIREQFVVPTYIKDAIKFVTKGELNV